MSVDRRDLRVGRIVRPAGDDALQHPCAGAEVEVGLLRFLAGAECRAPESDIDVDRQDQLVHFKQTIIEISMSYFHVQD
jgi:hypothetical protein